MSAEKRLGCETMKNSLSRIRLHRKQPFQWLASYILFLPFCFGLLLDLIGLPGFLKYTIDLAWAGCVFMALDRQKWTIQKQLVPLAVVAGVFFLYTLLAYLLKFQSAAYYLWGFRNNFRMYLAFFIFACSLEEDHVEGFFRVMERLFWLSIGISLIQYVVLGYEQDYLGGIFGVEQGSNTYTIIFFSIMLTRSVLSMMNGTETMMACLSKCVAALSVAVLAEMVAFFLIFVLLVVLATIFTKFSWKKCLLYVVIAFLFFVSSFFLVEIFGEDSAISIEKIAVRLFSSNYATTSDLGRLTAISTLKEKILLDLPSRLFGLGLGNCDTSSFAICNTPFYETYSTLHYNWFSSAFLFLETGYVGLTLYIGFLIVSFIQACKKMRENKGNVLHCQIAAIMSVLSVVYVFYNAGLRMEAGYMVYFALALPYMKSSKQAV